MVERKAVDAEADVRLLRLLRMDTDAAVCVRHRRIRRSGLRAREVAEQILCAFEQTVADAARDAEHHARRLVPLVEIAHERVARRVADRLLDADDVAAERL